MIVEYVRKDDKTRVRRECEGYRDMSYRFGTARVLYDANGNVVGGPVLEEIRDWREYPSSGAKP